jgi:translation initiation factor 2 subunit 1
MLYVKDGFPDVNEIVLCKVTKIYGNTTFVDIPEYEKEGVLTISEIAPGRIRNLRDHVDEGRIIVCKVLRVDPKQNRVDVSLRRVNIQARNKKLEETKKEEYAEKIYIDVAKELGITKDELFEKTYEPIFENFETVFEALYEIMIDNEKINMFKKLKKKEKEIFLEVINNRIKPEEIVLKKKFHLTSDKSNAIVLIKEAIKNAKEKIKFNNIEITYLAAGLFGVKIVHDNIKDADKIKNEFFKELEKEAKEKELKFEIEEK